MSPASSASRIAVDETPSSERDRSRLDAEPLEEREVAAPAAAEPEVLARDDDPRSDRAEDALDELLGRPAARAPA